MNKEIYLFRHGETDANKERRWQGCSINLPLNDVGIAQAKAVGDKLKEAKLEVIFSSPLKRALQTAEIVAESLSVPVIVKDDFREGCFGKAEGMPITELNELWPDITEKWLNSKELDVCFPGGESKQQIQNRMLKALNNLVKEEYQVMGVVTHGAATRNLLLGLGVKQVEIPNGAVFHFIHQDGRWQIAPE